MENETYLSASLHLAVIANDTDDYWANYDSSNESDLPDNVPNNRVQAIRSDLIFWAIVDGLLVFVILGGNTLTILALRFSRRLRSVISNMFVLSLAISDLVVGFTLPFHLALYMSSGLGRMQEWCLLRFFLIIIACCVSIWNLTAIAVDRYIAILYPLHYSRYMNKRVAITLLGSGWTLSTIIAAVPMFWNNWQTADECEFDEVLPPWYMAGVITPIFSIVWICLLFAYFRIWREASRQVKQLRSSNNADRVSDWKSVQVVLLILGGFSVCWLPYFIIACIQIFSLIDYNSPILYKSAFSLAMANSGMNPLIYAWKNKNFRRAFVLLLRCKNPDTAYRDDCINNNAPHTPPIKKPRPMTTTSSGNGSDFGGDKNSSGPGSSLGSHTSSRSNMNNHLSNSHSITVDEVHITTIAGQLSTRQDDQTDSGFISGGSSDCHTTSDINAIESDPSTAASSTTSTTSTTASTTTSTGTEFIDTTFDFKCNL